MASKNVSIRLAAVGGKNVKAEFVGIGEAGQRGFRKISREAEIANAKLASFARRAKLAGRIMGVAMVAAGVAMVRSGLQTIDAQAKLAASLGTTTASMQVLARAADLAGVSQGEVEQATIMMTKSLSQAAAGTGPAVKALQQLHLSAADLAKLPIDQKMIKIQDAIAKFIPTAQQAAVASQIFGARAGLIFTRIDSATLRQATKDVVDFGVAVSERDAAQIQVTNDALSRMGLLWRGIANQLAVAVAPALQSVTDAMANFAKTTGPLGGIIKIVLGRLKELVFVVGAFATVLAVRAVAALGATVIGIARVVASLTLLKGAVIRTGIGAGIALLGELAFQFATSKSRADEFGSSVASLRGSIDEYNGVSRSAQSNAAELAKKYGSLTGKARELLVAQQNLARQSALADISASALAASKSFGDLGGASREAMVNAGQFVDNTLATMKLVREEMATAKGAAHSQLVDVYKNLRVSLHSGGDIDVIQKLQKDFGITAKAAGNLAAALADLRDAKGIDNISAALDGVRKAYVDALGGTEAMTAEQRKFLVLLTNSSLAALGMRANLEDAPKPITAASTAAAALTTALRGATGQAAALSTFLSGLPGALAGSAAKIAGLTASIAMLAGGGDAAAASIAKYRAELVATLPLGVDIPSGIVDLERRLIEQKVADFAATKALAAEERKRLATLAKLADVAKGGGGGGGVPAPDPTVIAGWNATVQSLADYAKNAQDWGDNIGTSFVGAFKSAEGAFADFVKGGKFDFRSLISSMLADLALLEFKKNILGPIASFLTGSVLASVNHAGGIVGAGGAPMRSVPALAFAGAPRMHIGGYAGLRPGEVPAILQRGERVLSRREVAAGAGGGGTTQVAMTVNVDGARGNAEIQQMVMAGVEAGLEEYNRNVLPVSVAQISANPRGIG